MLKTKFENKCQTKINFNKIVVFFKKKLAISPN